MLPVRNYALTFILPNPSLILIRKTYEIFLVLYEINKELWIKEVLCSVYIHGDCQLLYHLL